jgi:hypothetical protein
MSSKSSVKIVQEAQRGSLIARIRGICWGGGGGGRYFFVRTTT